ERPPQCCCHPDHRTQSCRQQGVCMEYTRGIQYGRHDGKALIGDLYLPQGTGNHPAIVAVHGGGWQAGSRDTYRYMGRYLAERGYAVFTIDYPLTQEGQPRYPAALHDVRGAVQWLRDHAADFTIDPRRFALMGDSAGAHLAAMVALAGDTTEFSTAY